MSIASQITRINTNIAAAYDEAEAKGATMPATENSANLAQTVASIPEAVQPTLITKQITANGTYAAEDDNADGYSEVTVNVPIPTPVEEKDVNFYDYDGTVLYAYTAQEALALTALPEAPTHEGLTFQGWNRTLTQLQAYVTDYGVGDIGTTYITDDGATRLYLEVGEDVPLDYELYVRIANGTLSVEVDGVELGSATETTDSYVNYTIPLTLPNRGNVRVDLKFTGTGGFHIGQGALRTRIFGWNSEQNDTIVKVLFGRNITSISSYAFSCCSSLNSIILPSNITSISNFAFQKCSSLNSIILPSNITSIGDYVFHYCSSLNSIILPSNITSITSYAFSSCSSLNSIILPSNITSIGDYVFSSCFSLNSIILPSNITSIGDYAFQKCSSLNSIILPSNITSIGNYAFQLCSSLNSIILPSNITSISSYAFSSCSSLNSIILPSNITSISSYAFSSCSLLLFLDLSLYTDPSSLPVLSSTNALSGTPSDQKIYVYDQSCLDALSTMTNWSTYASRMVIKEATS